MLRFDVFRDGVPAADVDLSGAYVFGQDQIPVRGPGGGQRPDFVCQAGAGRSGADDPVGRLIGGQVPPEHHAATRTGQALQPQRRALPRHRPCGYRRRSRTGACSTIPMPPASARSSTRSAWGSSRCSRPPPPPRRRRWPMRRWRRRSRWAKKSPSSTRTSSSTAVAAAARWCSSTASAAWWTSSAYPPPIRTCCATRRIS